MLHSLGAFALHILGKVAVNVQCKGRSGVSQIGLKRFDVITGTNAVHCIIVAQIVDTQVGQPDFLNDTLVGIVDSTQRYIASLLIGKHQAATATDRRQSDPTRPASRSGP